MFTHVFMAHSLLVVALVVKVVRAEPVVGAKDTGVAAGVEEAGGDLPHTFIVAASRWIEPSGHLDQKMPHDYPSRPLRTCDAATPAQGVCTHECMTGYLRTYPV